MDSSIRIGGQRSAYLSLILSEATVTQIICNKKLSIETRMFDWFRPVVFLLDLLLNRFLSLNVSLWRFITYLNFTVHDFNYCFVFLHKVFNFRNISLNNLRCFFIRNFTFFICINLFGIVKAFSHLAFSFWFSKSIWSCHSWTWL